MARVPPAYRPQGCVSGRSDRPPRGQRACKKSRRGRPWSAPGRSKLLRRPILSQAPEARRRAGQARPLRKNVGNRPKACALPFKQFLAINRSGPVVPEQPRQRAVGQQTASRLTRRAVVALVIGVDDSLHARSTDWTWLPEPARARPCPPETSSPSPETRCRSGRASARSPW